MTDEQLLMILIVIIVIFIAFLIFKSLIKAVIITSIIVILFRIGWVYKTDDLKNNFKLDKYVNPNYAEKIYKTYDNYVEKREQNAIINAEKLEETIRDDVDKKVSEYINQKK